MAAHRQSAVTQATPTVAGIRNNGAGARHAGATHAAAPYIDLDRGAWSRLRESHPMSLQTTSPGCAASATGSTSTRSRRSTSRSRGCCNFYVEATHGLHHATSEFLGERPTRVPFVIGVAGSVAVGKSTTSRILKELLTRWPDTPRVELVTTDGFLPNAELERRDCCSARVFPSPTTAAR